MRYKDINNNSFLHLVMLAALLGFVICFTGIIRQPNLCRQQDIAEIPDAAFENRVFSTAADGRTQEEKIVCLTFDDGPSKTTKEILKILQQKGVSATFFVIAAENNRKYLPLVEQEAAQGHQIALHSASHEYKQIYQSCDSYWKDIAKLQESLAPYVKTDEIRYLRFPGGSTNTVSRKYGGSGLMKQLKQQAEEKDYRYIDWNVCAEDAAGGHPSAEEIYRNIISEAKEKTVCVVLMHDTNATQNTADALPDVIDWFKEQNYRFCTVEQMDKLCGR